MSKTMDVKMPPSAAAGRRDLGFADDQIARLKKRFLPQDPHILKVTKEITADPAIEEYKRTAFQDYEVRNLQYMTLVYEDLHGDTLKPHGDWTDEIEAGSPTSLAALSNTSTPVPLRDPSKPLKKLKLSDYKNLQKNGTLRTSPKSRTETGPNGGPPRPANTIAESTPMSRMSSLEGPIQSKLNGGSAEVNQSRTEKAHVEEKSRPVGPSSHPQDRHHDVKGPPRSVPNGSASYTTKNNSQSKDANKEPRAQNPRYSQLPPASHTLPPRPSLAQSPRRYPEAKYSSNESRQPKRSLDSNAATQPEKRARIEPPRSMINAPSNMTRKPQHSNGKPSSKVQNSHSTPRAISPPKKSTPPKKRIETSKSSTSSAERPLDLPPLLSPLPADLEPSPSRLGAGPTGLKKLESGKNSSQSTSSKGKSNADTVAAKKLPKNALSPHKTPPDSSSPFIPPPMLSPGLPEIVEQELLKIQTKAEGKKAEGKKKPEEKSVLNSVEARHEKVRRPDTPGVARKITTPKVGHPPKKTNGESSKLKAAKEEPLKKNGESSKASAVLEESEAFMINLKIPKRLRKDVSRILGIKPRPDKAFLRLEQERVSGSAPSQEPEHKILPKTAGKTVMSAVSKKRNSDSFEDPVPSSKRVKGPNGLDVSKNKAPVETSFKSPAVNTPSSSQKNLLLTPKKGEAFKTVAGRKLDTNDTHARTPQMANGNTSAPASAEKPRINGTNSTINRNSIPIDEHQQSGTTIKRKMDEIMHLKDPEFNPANLTEAEKKLGMCAGIESLTHYMYSTWSSRKHDINAWEEATGLFEFVYGRTRTFQLPVLHPLVCQVYALYKEGLVRACAEAVEKEGPGSPKAFKLVKAVQDRSRLWAQAHAGQASIDALGGEFAKWSLGPWATQGEAMKYVETVLGKYAAREGLGWKKFPGEY